MRIDDDLYALALQLGHALEARRQLAATAESCTGGLVAGAITAVAGSSAWFDRGFITYSNEAKIEQLGVSRETLATFGAVSTQTAAEMAEGALRASRAQWTLAVTGVAGPGGGTIDKPSAWYVSLGRPGVSSEQKRLAAIARVSGGIPSGSLWGLMTVWPSPSGGCIERCSMQ
jgi:nicotinamide-nucleotide amidase